MNTIDSTSERVSVTLRRLSFDGLVPLHDPGGLWTVVAATIAGFELSSRTEPELEVDEHAELSPGRIQSAYVLVDLTRPRWSTASLIGELDELRDGGARLYVVCQDRRPNIDFVYADPKAAMRAMMADWSTTVVGQFGW